MLAIASAMMGYNMRGFTGVFNMSKYQIWKYEWCVGCTDYSISVLPRFGIGTPQKLGGCSNRRLGGGWEPYLDTMLGWARARDRPCGSRCGLRVLRRSGRLSMNLDRQCQVPSVEEG